MRMILIRIWGARLYQSARSLSIRIFHYRLLHLKLIYWLDMLENHNIIEETAGGWWAPVAWRSLFLAQLRVKIQACIIDVLDAII